MLASRGKVAIPIAMSVPDQMPLAEVKNRLSEVVDRLEREHGHVIITKHGRPAAIVISVEDLQSLEETLDIMNSAALLADIRKVWPSSALAARTCWPRTKPCGRSPAGDGARARVPHRLDRRVAPGAVQASGACRAATIEFFYGSLAESPRRAWPAAPARPVRAAQRPQRRLPGGLPRQRRPPPGHCHRHRAPLGRLPATPGRITRPRACHGLRSRPAAAGPEKFLVAGEARQHSRPQDPLDSKLTGFLWGSAAVSRVVGFLWASQKALTCPADPTLGGEILRLLGVGDQLSE